MSPVEAQATARTASPSRMACRTTETSTVMPRSLNEPVWLLPQSLTHTSSRPIERPYRSAQKRLVPPSAMDTTSPSATAGATHSRLPHTPDPWGQRVRFWRSSKRFIQAAALRSRRASRSCETSSRPPQVGQR